MTRTSGDVLEAFCLSHYSNGGQIVLMYSSQPCARPWNCRLLKLSSPWFFWSLAIGLLWAALCFMPMPVVRRVATQLPARPAPASPSKAPVVPKVPVRVASAPLPAASAAPSPIGKMVRVGLCTQGSAVQLWSRLPLLISDPAQPGRTLLVKAEDKVVLSSGAPAKIPAPGGKAFYSGTLQVRTSSGVSGAWKSVFVTPPFGARDEFTRLTTNSENPRWGRPYRGAFEVTPLVKPFDTSKYKGALRVVNVVEMEQYLKGVVPWEMTPTAPLEALKAQAICARSELLAKMNSGRFHPYGFDVTDYDNCQGYPGAENEKPLSTLAVTQTKGQVLMYKGRIADAVYGTNSGGITASDEDVWKGGATPYLRGVRDFSSKLHSTMARLVKSKMTEDDWVAYCSQNLPAYGQPDTVSRRQLASRRATSSRVAKLFQPDDLPEFYRWSRFVTPANLAKAISAQSVLDTKIDNATEIRVMERASSGHIKKLAIFGVVTLGRAVNNRSSATSNPQPTIATKPVSVVLQGDSQIRSMLSGVMGSTTALPSSTFVALPQKDANGALAGWILKGAGWGHGVGMCQRGAQNRALEGWSAQRILQFYFTGVEIRPLVS